MAQKINPIALRLNTNLNFDSCWYNNSNYVNLLIRDIKVKNYINLILKKMKFCHARFLIENLHNKHKINVFFCNPIKSRADMLVSLRVKNYKINKAKKPDTRNVTQLSSKLNPLVNLIDTEGFPTAANSLSCFSKKQDCLQLKKCKIYNYLNLVTASLPVLYSLQVFQKATEVSLVAQLKHSKNNVIFSEKNTFSPATVKYAYTIEKLNLIYIKYFLIKYFSSDLAGKGLCKNNLGHNKLPNLRLPAKLLAGQTEVSSVSPAVFLRCFFSFLSICKQKNAHLVENLLFLKFPQFYISLNTFKKETLYTKKLFLLKKSSGLCLKEYLPTNKYTNKMQGGVLLPYSSLLNKCFLKKNISGSKKNNYKQSSWQPHNKLQQLLTPRAFTLNNYILLSLINAQYLRKTYTDYCNLSINSIKHTQIFSVNPLISSAKNYSEQSSWEFLKKPRGFSFPGPNKILKTGGYKTHIESMIHENFALSVNLQFFKTSNIFQSASFLCNEIVYYLEKKVPFFKLKNIVLKKLTHDCLQLPCSAKLQIKGIRVMCSGVVPGKSKKSQKSKIQSFKYGETSLHVFSCKIDFKSKTALTNFGTLGVKVWICYA